MTEEQRAALRKQFGLAYYGRAFDEIVVNQLEVDDFEGFFNAAMTLFSCPTCGGPLTSCCPTCRRHAGRSRRSEKTLDAAKRPPPRRAPDADAPAE